MASKAEVNGYFPVEVGLVISESDQVLDTNTGRSTMGMEVKLFAPEPFNGSFLTTETISVDQAVISDVSAANYPHESSELVPKIIDGFIKEEASRIEELKLEREKEKIRRTTSVVRVGCAVGVFTGSAMTGTVALIAEGRYGWAWATGWATVVGGFVMSLGVRKPGDKIDYSAELKKSNETSKEIEDSIVRNTVLKLIKSASDKKLIQNVDSNVLVK